LAQFPLGRFAFNVGPVFVYFKNSLKVQLSSDIYTSTNISNQFDLYGKSWVEIEQKGTDKPKMRSGSSINIDISKPDITTLAKGSIVLGVPRLLLESKLYGKDIFAFFGRFDHRLIHTIDPLAKDFRVKVTSDMNIRGGIKGKIAILDYNVFLGKSFNEKYIGGYYPPN